MWKRTGKRFSLTRERSHNGRIREMLQEDSCSSMYKVYDYMIHVREKKIELCKLLAVCLFMLDYVT